MSDIIESSIYDSIAYNKVTPVVLVSLGSLYISILLYRYLKWRYRRRKAKNMRLYRQKLEKFWRKQVHPMDSPQVPPVSHLAHRLPHLFDSTATLVSPSENHQVYSMHHLKEVVAEEEGEEEVRSSISGKKQQHRINRTWVGKVTSRLLDGDRHKRKRRQLLWQWSVAMGYCRYNHGYQLNSLIEKLVDNKTSSSSSCSHDPAAVIIMPK